MNFTLSNYSLNQTPLRLLQKVKLIPAPFLSKGTVHVQ